VPPPLTHSNSGACLKCEEIMNTYPGMNRFLKEWFQSFQRANPIFHISCAGRGFEAQEAAKKEGTSRAHYGQSAHNYNCAVDLFIQSPGVNLYDKKLFSEALKGKIPYVLNWYGTPGSLFYELPHVELRAWQGLLAEGVLALVEPKPEAIA
jgi:hypothetical protein